MVPDQERASKRGMTSATLAERVRSKGMAVIPHIERGPWPFTEDMGDRRPHTVWPSPTLKGIHPDQVVVIYGEHRWTKPSRL